MFNYYTADLLKKMLNKLYALLHKLRFYSSKFYTLKKIVPLKNIVFELKVYKAVKFLNFAKIKYIT